MSSGILFSIVFGCYRTFVSKKADYKKTSIIKKFDLVVIY